MKAIRAFHPIGQGAFYTEVLEFCDNDKFVMVYDCGSLNNKKIRNAVIDDFLKTIHNLTQIDILFISHFDKDHVNGIDYLLSQKHVNKIIVPVISITESLVLKQYYENVGGKNFEKVILLLKIASGLNNSSVIGDTKVIRVRDKTEQNELYIDKLNDKTLIESKTSIISSRKSGGYIYVPFNINQKEKEGQLKKLLVKHGLSLDNLSEDFFNSDNGNMEIIKEIYKQLKGGINSNSMCVYSGSSKNNNLINKNGALYTGDFNAKKHCTTLKNGYKHVWNNISLIQVPHHGSVHNHDKDLYSKDTNTVISCHKNNKHHPFPRIVYDIFQMTRKVPSIVTEDPVSKACFHMVI